MNNIKRHAAVLAVSVLIGLGLNIHVGTSPFDKPCRTESSNGCFWDAGARGNHKGRSYVVTSDGQIFYFSKRMSEHAEPFGK